MEANDNYLTAGPRNKLRILYTGPFGLGSMTEARRKALSSLGYHVFPLDQLPYLARGPGWFQKLQRHLLLGSGIRAYNRDLVHMADDIRPDMIYIDQAVYLYPSSVQALRIATPSLVHYTSEYLNFKRYIYRHFFKTVNLYDVHVLTNHLSAEMLTERHARRIVMSHLAYDSDLHRPPELTSDNPKTFETDVVLVGHWEPAYERAVTSLRKAGIAVQVWGNNWRRSCLKDRKLIRPVFGPDYSTIVAAAKIGLGVLSEWNFNQSASRTFEIPAIGGFLLAKRTNAHLAYYREGKEAEFYDSEPELVEKARYYLSHDEERRAIALAGHQRCLTSGYSQRDRMQQILEAILSHDGAARMA